jgi:hypothetical protein
MHDDCKGTRSKGLIAVLVTAVLCYSQGSKAGFGGGGVFAVFTISLTYNYLCTREGNEGPLRKAFAEYWSRRLWDMMVLPVMLALTGAIVDIRKVFAREYIGWYFLILVVGILVRMVVTYACCTKAPGFTWKEKLFVTVSWIAKALVQVALGSLTLDTATKALAKAKSKEDIAHNKDLVRQATRVFHMSVMAILFGSITGFLFIKYTAPCLLTKDDNVDEAPAQKAEPETTRSNEPKG